MPLQVLEPLQMACVMDVPRIAEPALGCLHKLVSRPAQPKAANQIQEPAVISENISSEDVQIQVLIEEAFKGLPACRCLTPTCMGRAAPLAAWMMAALCLR